MASIESAGEVSEEARTLFARQWNLEEPRNRLTNTGNRSLDLLGGCRINVHLQCPAYVTIDNEAICMNFRRCRFTALHRSSYAVAPLPIAKARDDENSSLRCHARGR